MEQKLVRVPFEVELAKEITNGTKEGKVVTRNGRNARIICWDAHCNDNIVALIEDEKGVDFPKSYVSDGLAFLTGESDCDLMLEIPEYMTFKDGDIATLGWKSDDGEFCEWITILKSVEADEINILTEDYVTVCLKCDEENYFPIDFDCTSDGAKWIRKPTEPEKQELIDALKASKEPKAKEYLKRFFNIEVKPECEFKPFDKVLARECETDKWRADLFSHMNEEGEFICISYVWDECIPYNENTAHLLGTTDNWEG